MRRFIRVFAALATACAVVVLIACGGPTSGPEDPTKITVPAQPPQPVPTAPAPAPLASPSAGPIAVPPFTCKSGKTFEANGRSYCAYPEVDTWEGSEARCVEAGGHLMAFETRGASEALHLALGSPARAGRAAWIGLESPTRPSAGWKWITGQPVTIASWNVSEPNNWSGNEACGEWLVASGKWNDTRCDLRQPYLCESIVGSTLHCTGHPSSGKSSTYCYVGKDLPFAQAKVACKQMGGQLATPKTAEENETLRTNMAQRFEATRMWIGLNDLAEEGSWVWTTGVKPRFTAWAQNEPNAYGREGCVELFSDRWTWNDLDCAQKLPSVCEGPAKKP